MTDMGLRLDAVGIVVSDLAASVRFYRLLGLEFPEPGPDEGHLEAVTDTGLRLMLDLESVVRTCDPGWTRPDGQSIGLAFLCASPAEVDATFERVVGAGFGGKSAPWDAFWGQRYAQVTDPDGHAVDLFAPLPG
jgi:catechol 2,3-dioxygenase-like lactoylglutathione lyase family enzyme